MRRTTRASADCRSADASDANAAPPSSARHARRAAACAPARDGWQRRRVRSATPVPVQMWAGRPSPTADVGGVPMWAGGYCRAHAVILSSDPLRTTTRQFLSVRARSPRQRTISVSVGMSSVLLMIGTCEPSHADKAGSPLASRTRRFEASSGREAASGRVCAVEVRASGKCA